LAWAREHLEAPLTVEDMAEQAGMSSRHFARAFIAETGTTPSKAVERLRIEVTRQRVQSSSEAIERVAQLTGFRDPERRARGCELVIRGRRRTPALVYIVDSSRTCREVRKADSTLQQATSLFDHLVGKAYPTPWPAMLGAMNARRYPMRYPPTSLLMTSPNNSQRSPLNFLS
jgi:AraC-like DNA-binding protein